LTQESWPHVLKLIAEVAGDEAALAFARAYGGTRVYVPRPEAIKQDHNWAMLIGLDPARAVAEALSPGETWMIPHGPMGARRQRDAKVHKMRAQGHSFEQIAHALQVDTRTIYRVIARGERGPSPQLDLFEEG
jgi:Mor family transcriptional regulator